MRILIQDKTLTDTVTYSIVNMAIVLCGENKIDYPGDRLSFFDHIYICDPKSEMNKICKAIKGASEIYAGTTLFPSLGRFDNVHGEDNMNEIMRWMYESNITGKRFYANSTYGWINWLALQPELLHSVFRGNEIYTVNSILSSWSKVDVHRVLSLEHDYTPKEEEVEKPKPIAKTKIKAAPKKKK